MSTVKTKKMPAWFYEPKTAEERRKVRVIIAQDAVQWLRGIGYFKGVTMPKPVVKAGNTYMRVLNKLDGHVDILPWTSKDGLYGEPVQPALDMSEILSKEAAVCEVCARGALFLADVMKHDKFTADDFCYGGGWQKREERAFSATSVADIEAHFEDRDMCYPFSKDALEHATPKKIRDAFRKDLEKNDDYDWVDPSLKREVEKYRLIAICHNIIDHGDFKPHKGVRKKK